MSTAPLSAEEEMALIQKVGRGNTLAFTPLVEQHKCHVFTLCLKMMKDRAGAEDAAQEAFIKAYEKIASFKGQARFSTWLYRIAFNVCLNELRKGKNRFFLDLDEAAHELETSTVAGTWDLIFQKEKAERVLAVIAGLSQEDQLVLTLFYLHEQSLEEMEQITGVNRKTLKVKLFRARGRLEKKLKGNFEEIY